MHDLNAIATAGTIVRVELDGRPALIKDLRLALDTFKAEGIPDTCEVSFHQSEDRGGDSTIPYAERPTTHRMWIEAQRASVTPNRRALEAMSR